MFSNFHSSKARNELFVSVHYLALRVFYSEGGSSVHGRRQAKRSEFLLQKSYYKREIMSPLPPQDSFLSQNHQLSVQRS